MLRTGWLALLLVACAGNGAHTDEPLGEHEPGDAIGATRADRERVSTPPGQPATGTLEMHISRLPSGEIAIDLDAHRFAPRALDPVLVIGQHRFPHYSHPAPGVLRYSIGDGAMLESGARVAIEYPGEPPIVITDSLVVPPEVRQ